MRYLAILIGGVLAWAPTTPVVAGHGHGDEVGCPACNYVCEFSTEQVTEKKTCYDVECKPICIPPITFPWERGNGKGKGKGGDCDPGPRCGKVKVVRVLVKQEYECSRCKCTWTAVSLNGDKSDQKSSDNGGGEEATTDFLDDALTPALVDPSAEKQNPLTFLFRLAKQRANVSHLFTKALE